MHKQKVFLIGPCGGGGIPKNGASAKNYHLMKFFEEHHLNVTAIDTENWRRNPLILIKLVFYMLFYSSAKFIVATDNMSGYRVMRVFSCLPYRNIIYWVIGGSIADWIKEGRVMIKPYKVVNYFLVEGNKMKKTLAECGFCDNVLYVPNFKKIDYVPTKQVKETNKINFVFLSRIIPEKGCRLILDAVNILNQEYEDSFSVTFYGPIEDSFMNEFIQKVDVLDNVEYKGFLDLRYSKNYDVLSKYDAMLFPSFWRGEGFPGIVVDAYIAGLPVIASDWSLNADIVKDGKTGFVIPNKKLEPLVEIMRRCIRNPEILRTMSCYSQKMAKEYSIENVINEELLKKIGL